MRLCIGVVLSLGVHTLVWRGMPLVPVPNPQATKGSVSGLQPIRFEARSVVPQVSASGGAESLKAPAHLSEKARTTEAPSPFTAAAADEKKQMGLSVELTSSFEQHHAVASNKPSDETTSKLDILSLVSESGATSSYITELAAHLSAFQIYPRAARRRGWQGEVEVTMRLNANGAILAASISNSSGITVLDKAALQMLDEAQPFPAPKVSDSVVEVSLPISFRLR